MVFFCHPSVSWIREKRLLAGRVPFYSPTARPPQALEAFALVPSMRPRCLKGHFKVPRMRPVALLGNKNLLLQ